MPYQAEGPQHREASLLGRAQLYQAHGDDDAVEDIPPFLEVIVGVKGNDFEDHFSSEKHGEDLQTETRSSSAGGRGARGSEMPGLLNSKYFCLVCTHF